ncbi:MAG: hypothetical protein ABJC28_05630, partial [Acidobacteriota bacterium]
QALQDYVRQAPGVIERTKNKDSIRLAPVLAREKSLPPSTLEALQERAVVSGRGRLGGPGAEDLASRGTIVERSRTVSELLGSRGFEKGTGNGNGKRAPAFERGRKPPVSIMPGDSSSAEAPMARVPRNDPDTREIGRGRGREVGRVESPDAPRPVKNPERVAPAPVSEEWRQRGGSGRQAPPAPVLDAPRQKPAKPVAREEDWRGRGDSPAKRVIDGAVPGRRWQDDAPRVKEAPADWRQRVEQPAPAPREYRAPRMERPPQYSPPQREYRPEPREYKAAPPPQREYRPEYRPEPREYRAPPPQREYRPAPPPRVERAAPPPPQAPAPPPPTYKGHGKGDKG